MTEENSAPRSVRVTVAFYYLTLRRGEKNSMQRWMKEIKKNLKEEELRKRARGKGGGEGGEEGGGVMDASYLA